jgi:ABC-type antimicrobial peptide transport system permease subunit
MGVPLLMGRNFTAHDAAQAKPVVIVNEAFVSMHFPGESPLGKTANGEIIGVVRNAPPVNLRRPTQPAIYWAYRQGAFGRMTFRVRTTVDAASVFPAIRDSLQEVDAQLPISNVRTFAEQVNRGLAQENMFAGLSTLFGVLAVVLTCVGFYGVMAYDVARRTNEIGVRLAMGARPVQMSRLIMSEGLFLVVIGAGLGILGAFASTHYVESVLFGVAADDGITITAAVFVMLVIAAIAAFLPARKASRIDPLIALRYE